jgi:hypothetical protein
LKIITKQILKKKINAEQQDCTKLNSQQIKCRKMKPRKKINYSK